MEGFGFQKLDVYKEAKELVKLVYVLLEKYPKTEMFALCDQLRRAVISVPSNIAEGMGRASSKEQVHFLGIAYGSLMEVLCQMELSSELGYISNEDFVFMEQRIERVAKLLSGLRKALRRRMVDG